MALALTLGAMTASAAALDDNMTPYRKLANDSMAAYEAHDMPTAKKKAHALEKAWDKREKALKKKSPDVWEQIDTAVDAFVKPMMKKEEPDVVKTVRAYDTLLSKFELAVRN